MLESLLHHKKEEKEYLATLVVTEDRIDAATWETNKTDKVTVLSTASSVYAGEWEAAITASDQAISEVESKLPQGVELEKVVFGLFPEWVSDDHIKDTYLKKLKTLTEKLELIPMGYVELPLAVAKLLHQDEGTMQTVILIGLESKHLTVSLFKIGHLAATVTKERTENICSDLEKILTGFTEIEVLPSRILLYGTSSDLEKVKSQLLDYPWQKKANFLHFPKIEVLKDDFAVKAVSIASATEITPHKESDEVLTAKPETDEIKSDKKEVENDVTTSEAVDEVDQVAEDLGFVKDSAKTKNISQITKPEELNDEEVANVEPVVPSAKSVKRSIKLPKFNFPKFTITLKMPRIPKFGFIIALVLLIVLLGGGLWGAYWFLPSATVKILVSPQTLGRTESITVDPKASSVDVENKTLPSKEVGAQVKGSKTIATTGKKTVGDKAKGEITIYNKTLNSKTFKKGTEVLAGKLKFTLDDEVSIASASESVGSLTYGSSKVAITAADIGTASNVPPSTDFTLSGLPANLYSGKNDKAFSGGTSKEISVVSRDDQKAVREQAVKELETQAQSDLKGKITDKENLLDKSITSKVDKETFDKEIGEETDKLTINMDLTVTALVYNQDDLTSLLTKALTDKIPQNYEYNSNDVSVKVEEVKEGKNGIRIFTTHVSIKLMPKVETQDLAKNLTGKTPKEAADYLKNQNNISGVEINLDSPLPIFKDKLPANSGKIEITIETL